MIRSILYPPAGDPIYNIALEEIPKVLADPAVLLWVSLEKPDPSEIDLVLADLFHFHPLAVEDCQSVGYQNSEGR